jgi:acyl-CoA thioester hydrolase
MDLASYPHVRDVSLVYGDVDVVGHVNNVAIARLFEEARASLGQRVRSMLDPGDQPRLLLVHIEIDFLREVSYPGAVQIGIGVDYIGATSVRHTAALFQDARCAAISTSVDVHTQPAPRCAAALGEPHKQVLRQLRISKADAG